MGLMSSKIEREELRPGDHIYTWRGGYSYSHHGIYVGDGKVIHLTRGTGLMLSSSQMSRSEPSNDRVVLCSTEAFLWDGQLYRFEYGVKGVELLIKRAGTCCVASSNPPEQVLHRASYLLAHGFGNYHILERNCEDFAIYCKTGLVRFHKNLGSISGQISFISIPLFAIITFPYQFLPVSSIVVALWAFLFYCKARLGSDVGSQGSNCDVVPVEKLEQLSNTRNVMENMQVLGKISTSWSVLKGAYFMYSLMAMRCWYWTPESKILVWLKSCLLYTLLYWFVKDHLEWYGFKLGVYSAYTKWLVANLYWRWRSVSTILLWTRVFFLSCFLSSTVSYQRYYDPRRSKLQDYMTATIFLLGLWHWTPANIILLWIKFILVHCIFMRVFNCRTNHTINTGLNLLFFIYYAIKLWPFF